MVSQTINHLITNDQTNKGDSRVMFTGEQKNPAHLGYASRWQKLELKKKKEILQEATILAAVESSSPNFPESSQD